MIIPALDPGSALRSRTLLPGSVLFVGPRQFMIGTRVLAERAPVQVVAELVDIP